MRTSSEATERGALRVRVIESAAADAVGLEVSLGDEPLWIGRGADCGLVVADPSVSRRHACLEASPEGVRVADNGSANGIVVEGMRVGDVALRPGQRFALGGSIFEIVGAPPAAPVVPPTEEFLGFDKTSALAGVAEIVAQFERPTALEELGDAETTAANKPMVLADAESVWLVVSGKVEIFTVALDGGKPTGARTHFLTVEPGQAFFGIDSERYGWDAGFLAVGKAGSQLRRFSLSRWVALTEVAAHRERLATLAAKWVEGLSRRLTRDMPLPESELTLLSGDAVDFPVGPRAVTRDEVLWIEVPAAQLLFDSMASLSYEVEGVLFPLGPGGWLERLSAGDETTVTIRTTVQAVADPRLWAGLEVFHRVLCECEFLNKKLATVDEFNRLQAKAEQVEEAREAAYGAIGSVLGGTGVWTRPTSSSSDLGPVFKACEIVGKELGVAVKNHPDAREQRTFEEGVQAIALVSRLRTRRVTLVDDWWNRDQGPLLCQIEETKAPVAVLPTSPTTYAAVDPATGERRKLTAEVARTLEPFAYTFYRSFGDKALVAKDLIKFGLRGLGKDFRMVAMMGVGLGMLGMVTPMITGRVFDSAIPQAERGMLVQFSIGLLLVAITQSAFKVTQSIAMLRVQGKMDYSVQAAVWDRLLDLPLTFFRKFSAGDLADRAGGVDQIRSIIAGAGVAAILGTLSSTFNVFQMATYDFKLAAVAIGLSVAYVSGTTSANYTQLRFQREEQKRRGRITGLVLQLITGVAKLRVCGAENHAFRVWAIEFAEQRRVSFKVGRVRNVMAVFNGCFPVFSSMAIFMTMVSLKEAAAESGTPFEMTTGDFLAFSAAYGLFLGAMQSLGDASLSMLKIVPIWERIKPIVSTLPEVDATKAYPGKLRGEIEISHVSFRYSEDSPWILKDVSLKIKSGEFVALVGGSGSGKSTLMRLMLGFEKPEKGAIYYDGQDLSTLDLRMVRAQLGVVLQESRLLPADIYRNIVGSSSRTVQEAWEAAEKAGLAEDVRNMPMQMHTVVSEGGGAFSGGQKQRLMIARALVHKPKILYLDEATSALDNKTQSIVTESMNKLSATRIAIAHRLSTVEGADKICYLELGQIKEMGNYAELMALDGLFAQLAKRQLA